MPPFSPLELILPYDLVNPRRSQQQQQHPILGSRVGPREGKEEDNKTTKRVSAVVVGGGINKSGYFVCVECDCLWCGSVGGQGRLFPDDQARDTDRETRTAIKARGPGDTFTLFLLGKFHFNCAHRVVVGQVALVYDHLALNQCFLFVGTPR